MGVGGQRQAPAALLSGKQTQYPSYRRLGGTQGQPGRMWEISPQPGFDLRTVQLVPSSNTDCAMPAHLQTQNTCPNYHKYQSDHRSR
jgi:hypothetical protein